MNLHKIYLVVLGLMLLIIIMPTSCSKTGYTIIRTTADSANQIIIANDELNVNYEFDQAVNEALFASTLSKTASGNTASSATGLYNTISSVTIDTSHITDSALIRLTYYGKNADQTKGRTGSITLQYTLDSAGKVIPWTNAGASVTITFNQYEVIILSNNKSIWVNGSATITNVSGGLLKAPASISIANGSALHDNVNGNITFTYNDNATTIVTWTWGLNQVRTFSIQSQVLTSTITGGTTLNGINNISTFGLTRFNDNFYTGVLSPVVQTISSSFLLSQPLSGEKVIHGIKEPLDVIYGVDSRGEPVDTGVPFGYKIIWQSNGGQAETVVSY